MDLFDELIEIEVGVITPYLQPLIEFCLEVSQNCSCDNHVTCNTTICVIIM